MLTFVGRLEEGNVSGRHIVGVWQAPAFVAAMAVTLSLILAAFVAAIAVTLES